MPRKRLPQTIRTNGSIGHATIACAGATVGDAYLEDLCFHAQQAAEKAVKAILMYRGVTFPFIHDIAKLLKLLEATGLRIPKYIRSGRKLTRFAVVTRYPGFIASHSKAK